MNTNKAFALVDVNNCYVSCERFFQPALNGKICVVLSNNDGCVIARSAEAKKAGIPMGMPYFKVQQVIKEQKLDVKVLSSNYSVYAEMSRRFHNILASFVGPKESAIYSIDEGFLDLTEHQNTNLTQMGKEIREKVDRYINLPVCVGIGRTKTEAKVANYIAKHYDVFGGVCNLIELAHVKDAFMWQMKVGDVWGVGRQYEKRLNTMGIEFAYQLMKANPEQIQKYFGVVLKRTVLELNGISCLELDDTPEFKKQIRKANSFGVRVTELFDLKTAITRYTFDAHRRLRGEKLVCGTMYVFVSTNPFDKEKPYFSNTHTASFPIATDDSQLLIKTANKLIEKVFVKGQEYKKCGVILTALTPKSSYNLDMFEDHETTEKSDALMSAIDAVHKRYGVRTLGFGASLMDGQKWTMKQAYKSQNYFTLKEMWSIDDDHLRINRNRQ
ncbi:Y-family DNA polymerase [Acinetobacter soli]|uniref:Y-family DNA polymerase n=1 Tax=Acinetobacter soli TaxID=487316 RepID=UPI00124FE9D5|nr:Y-family DNA polymerase [Acinetobacter soli]